MKLKDNMNKLLKEMWTLVNEDSSYTSIYVSPDKKVILIAYKVTLTENSNSFSYFVDFYSFNEKLKKWERIDKNDKLLVEVKNLK